jgi:hypothetical protein
VSLVRKAFSRTSFDQRVARIEKAVDYTEVKMDEKVVSDWAPKKSI